jgi:phosphoribosyl-dephospho-CoA transferase
MGIAVIPEGPAPAHHLVRLREPAALVADRLLPEWVAPALRSAPWVVVRRGHVRDGLVPVGVRGTARPERFAAFVTLAAIAERLAPEHLSARSCTIEPVRMDAVPALAALSRVALVLEHRRCPWGPGGSVGFEIATGVPMATVSSDLDLILYQRRRLAPDDAIALRAALAEAAAPARIDVILETPRGGVSLAEIAARPARLLVRTSVGARLYADPWADEDPTVAALS